MMGMNAADVEKALEKIMQVPVRGITLFPDKIWQVGRESILD